MDKFRTDDFYKCNAGSLGAKPKFQSFLKTVYALLIFVSSLPDVT